MLIFFDTESQLTHLGDDGSCPLCLAKTLASPEILSEGQADVYSGDKRISVSCADEHHLLSVRRERRLATGDTLAVCKVDRVVVAAT